MSDLTTYHKGQRNFGTGFDMMARIVELEAALEKAEISLEVIRDIAPRSKFTKQIAGCADDALKSISEATK